jgi:hypothetical protein
MNCQFAAMGRPSTMTEAGGGQIQPATATYGSANQLLTLGYGSNVGFLEMRTDTNKRSSRI